MSTCADDMKDKFKEKVMSQFLLVPEFDKFQEFRTLAFEEQPANVNDCAKKSHDRCITLFTGMQQQDEKNLCNGVTHFIQCYQTNKCLTSRLSITFADLIREMSAELIDAFKAHSMCEVDNTEL
ncbi:uncharacterized protein LOC116307644 [Actinia tenebrosa]|uniref:Uncharacterized protein LOC116307644 n=1 Tax=Actinia tenebrosa TaxID=6105 RepID=A0A6P8J2I9_ACTTE|nr:uncharacterized protein LOC116307644 [Actinia tenebrosa]